MTHRWRTLVAVLFATLNGAGAAAIPPSTLVVTHPTAAGGRADPERPMPGKAPSLDRADVEAWLDGFMPLALAQNDIAGATVAIVKDDRILLTKGYGYADRAKRIPVASDRHLFRVASVSKLFTWTAVMQQVEQGRLNLDVDVNRYLDFRISPYRGKPITLRNLMTHTAGFELVMRNLFSNTPSNPDLGATVKQWVPQQIYEPGSTPAYSNYGAALAGYIVQRVSGQPFDTYVERHIFQPLGMTRSSFRQPLPATLAKALSQGYLAGSGQPQSYEFTLYPPAGALASTAPDIARFMIAHLNDGALGPSRILRPETTRLMHATAYTALPPLRGMDLGFYEHDINGHRVRMHDGDTRYFHSQLNLFIDDNIGIFVSLNSTGRNGGADVVRAALFEQFADRYFPAAPSDGHVDPRLAVRHAEALTGEYEASTRSASNFLAINNFRYPTTIETDGIGGLTIPSITGYDSAPKRWREIAPFLWRDADGKDRLAAQLVDGRPVRFSVDEYSPIVVWDRIPWWRSTAWLKPLAYGAFAALLLTLAAWPITAVMRHRSGRPADSRPHRWVGLGLRLTALAGVVTPYLWLRTIAPVMSFTADKATIGLQIVLMSLLTLVACGGGLLLSLWNCGQAWTKRGWPSRLWGVVLVLSFGALFWIALVFKLLTFRTDF